MNHIAAETSEKVERSPEVDATFSKLEAVVNLDNTEFGLPHERANKIREFAVKLWEAKPAEVDVSPEALANANQLFFGHKDALTKVSGGAYYPEINRSKMMEMVTVPAYSGRKESSAVIPMIDLPPQVVAKAYLYAMATYQESSNPEVELKALGKRLLNELFDIDHSKFPDSAKNLLDQDVEKGTFQGFVGMPLKPETR